MGLTAPIFTVAWRRRFSGLWHATSQPQPTWGWPSRHGTSRRALEPRQYENNSIQSKRNPILKLPRYFINLHGEGKSAAISKLEFLWTEWSRSYIALALI